MKCREVNYVAVDGFPDFLTELEQSPEKLLKLVPVNYYALKNEYIKATCYSSADCAENYIIFSCIADSVRSEKVTFVSGKYKIERDLFIKAMAKFGIML